VANKKRRYYGKVDGVSQYTSNNTETGTAPLQTAEYLKMRDEAYAWAARVKAANMKPLARGKHAKPKTMAAHA